MQKQNDAACKASKKPQHGQDKSFYIKYKRRTLYFTIPCIFIFTCVIYGQQPRVNYQNPAMTGTIHKVIGVKKHQQETFGARQVQQKIDTNTVYPDVESTLQEQMVTSNSGQQNVDTTKQERTINSKPGQQNVDLTKEKQTVNSNIGQQNVDSTKQTQMVNSNNGQQNVDSTIQKQTINSKPGQQNVDSTKQTQMVNSNNGQQNVDLTIQEGTINSKPGQQNVDSTNQEQTINSEPRQQNLHSTKQEQLVNSNSGQQNIDSTIQEQTINSTPGQQNVDSTKEEQTVTLNTSQHTVGSSGDGRNNERQNPDSDNGQHSDSTKICSADQRKEGLRAACKHNGYTNKNKLLREFLSCADAVCKERVKRKLSYPFILDKTHKLVICMVPKTGVTSYTSMLMEYSNTFKDKHPGKSPFDVFGYRIYYHMEQFNMTTLNVLSDEDFISALTTYTKILSVRHPYTRLLSFYKDKVVGSDCKKLIGFPHKIIEYNRGILVNNTRDACKMNITFDEFLNYYKSNRKHDGNAHLRTISSICKPCDIDYDTYVRTETATHDQRYLIINYLQPQNSSKPVSTYDVNVVNNQTGPNILLTEYRNQTTENIHWMNTFYADDLNILGYDSSFSSEGVRTQCIIGNGSCC